jgi:hypothetical protein
VLFLVSGCCGGLLACPLWGVWWLCGRCLCPVVCLYIPVLFGVLGTKKPLRIAPGRFVGWGVMRLQMQGVFRLRGCGQEMQAGYFHPWR